MKREHTVDSVLDARDARTILRYVENRPGLTSAAISLVFAGNGAGTYHMIAKRDDKRTTTTHLNRMVAVGLVTFAGGRYTITELGIAEMEKRAKR